MDKHLFVNRMMFSEGSKVITRVGEGEADNHEVKIRLHSASMIIKTLKEQIILRDKEINSLRKSYGDLLQEVENMKNIAEVFGGSSNLRARISR